MRARVRTLGVEEHHFVIEKGKSYSCKCCTRFIDAATGLDVGTDVYVTDVGGARSIVSSSSPGVCVCMGFF